MLRHVASWGDRIPGPASNAQHREACQLRRRCSPPSAKARLLGSNMTPVPRARRAGSQMTAKNTASASDRPAVSLIYASSSGACRIVGLDGATALLRDVALSQQRTISQPDSYDTE